MLSAPPTLLKRMKRNGTLWADGRRFSESVRVGKHRSFRKNECFLVHIINPSLRSAGFSFQSLGTDGPKSASLGNLQACLLTSKLDVCATSLVCLGRNFTDCRILIFGVVAIALTVCSKRSFTGKSLLLGSSGHIGSQSRSRIPEPPLQRPRLCVSDQGSPVASDSGLGKAGLQIQFGNKEADAWKGQAWNLIWCRPCAHLLQIILGRFLLHPPASPAEGAQGLCAG